MSFRRRARTFNRDPHKLLARFRGTCGECKGTVHKGAPAFYYPATKTILGQNCCGAADRAARRFDAEVFDEAMMSGGAW